ncbi:MAG: cytochrome P450 [Sandaracinaceae bacterium]|nr:cytochrome P450 [Sandaracinaceae bacterium]
MRERERDYGLGDLEALMDAQVRFGREHPEIGRLFMLLMFEALGPSPELREHFRAFHARVHALGCAWVRAGIERGSVRADLDAAAAVDAMLGFFTGVRAHSLLLDEHGEGARARLRRDAGHLPLGRGARAPRGERMMQSSYQPRRVEAPERIDLDAAEPLLRPIWHESAREVLQLVLTGRPEAPPGARLAPAPEAADPLLGHLREGLGDPLGAFLRWNREVGDVVRLRLAGATVHLACHPRHVRTILQERARHYVKPMQGRRNLSYVLGNGLLVSEGSFWLRQRRIAQPAFHKRRIDGFGDRMIAASSDLAGEWEARARSGSPSTSRGR